MAGRITLWGAGELLMSFFAKATSAPDNFYLALIKDVPPTPYVSGAELDEPEEASYQRIPIPADLTGWNNNGQIHVIANGVEVSSVSATEDWGTLRFWALCSSPVDGYIYAVGDMEPISVGIGDTAVLYDGDLTITLGPFFSSEEL